MTRKKSTDATIRVCSRSRGTREKKLLVSNRANSRRMPEDASPAPGIRRVNCVSKSRKLVRIRSGVSAFIASLSKLIVHMLMLKVPGKAASTLSTSVSMSAKSGTGGIWGS